MGTARRGVASLSPPRPASPSGQPDPCVQSDQASLPLPVDSQGSGVSRLALDTHPRCSPTLGTLCGQLRVCLGFLSPAPGKGLLVRALNPAGSQLGQASPPPAHPPNRGESVST